MSRSPQPHVDFPAGTSVRVRVMHPTARPAKLRLVGRVGTVVQSSRTVILVRFPGEAYREHFLPEHLELAAAE